MREIEWDKKEKQKNGIWGKVKNKERPSTTTATEAGKVEKEKSLGPQEFKKCQKLLRLAACGHVDSAVWTYRNKNVTVTPPDPWHKYQVKKQVVGMSNIKTGKY